VLLGKRLLEEEEPTPASKLRSVRQRTGDTPDLPFLPQPLFTAGGGGSSARGVGGGAFAGGAFSYGGGAAAAAAGGEEGGGRSGRGRGPGSASKKRPAPAAKDTSQRGRPRKPLRASVQRGGQGSKVSGAFTGGFEAAPLCTSRGIGSAHTLLTHSHSHAPPPPFPPPSLRPPPLLLPLSPLWWNPPARAASRC
jgi:hypothetical protein